MSQEITNIFLDVALGLNPYLFCMVPILYPKANFLGIFLCHTCHVYLFLTFHYVLEIQTNSSVLKCCWKQGLLLLSAGWGGVEHDHWVGRGEVGRQLGSRMTAGRGGVENDRWVRGGVNLTAGRSGRWPLSGGGRIQPPASVEDDRWAERGEFDRQQCESVSGNKF